MTSTGPSDTIDLIDPETGETLTLPVWVSDEIEDLRDLLEPATIYEQPITNEE